MLRVSDLSMIVMTEQCAEVAFLSFGAVLEEFEVRDAISMVLATKHDLYSSA